MTDVQRLTIKASEQRQRLNELSGLDTLTDDQRGELDTLTQTYGDTERQLRAAIAAEPEPTVETHATPDAEDRERADLRRKATAGAYIAAHMYGSPLPTECAEYSAACGTPAGEIPLDLWEPEPGRKVETHADAVTETPSTVGVNIGAIRPAVFAASIAARLGISMPTVKSGTYADLRMTTSATAGARAKGAARESTALALTPVSTKPRSISARISFRAEDRLEVGTAAFEPAIRSNATLALSSEYDNQCVNGDGAAPNVKGLIKQLTRGTNPTDVADFDSMLKTVAAQVDGTWARGLGDVVTVVPSDVWQLSATAFRDVGTNNGHRGDIAASSYLARETGGWWTAARLPVAPTSGANAKVSTGICYRRGQSLTTAVHPVWSSLSITDPYTDSASAIHHFTAHIFVGAEVLLTQPDAYALALFKVKA